MRIRITDVRDDKNFGVLKLTLRSDSYEWEFVPIVTSTRSGFTDSGRARCH